MQVDAHRRGRETGAIRNLDAGHSFHESKHQRFLVSIRKRSDRLENGERFDTVRISGRDIVQEHFGPRSAASVIGRAMPGNRRQPAAERRRLSKIQNALERRHKHILDHVIHFIPSGPRQTREHDAMHHASKALIQLREGDAVASLGAPD